ncbi:MAG: hypothetical protein GXO74_07910 [Calditrichaeota bacterium]|nr:hypothetical protein [Calditrichota bacterium]
MKNLTQIFLVVFLFFVISPTAIFSQQGSSKYHASAKLGVILDRQGGESPLSYEISCGLNFTPFNTLLLTLNSYEIFEQGLKTATQDGYYYLGSGGVALRSFGLQYKFGLGNISSNARMQRIYLLAGFGFCDWSENCANIQLSAEYQHQISNLLSIPIGLKIVRVIEHPDDNRIENWDFFGFQIGFQIN